MRFIGMVRSLVIIGAAGFTLSACGSDADCRPADAETGAVDTKPVVKVDTYGYGKNELECAKGYTPVEIGIGQHTEDNASYKLSEIRGEKLPFDDVQQAVRLQVQPPAGVTIPSAIVHTVDSDDKELRVSVGKKGKVDAEIKTAEYADSPTNYNFYPISSITLCTKQTS